MERRRAAPASTNHRDPEWDFHEFVSLLGNHPQLLRILGIAVELEVDLPADPDNVRVHTDYDNGAHRRAVDFVMHTTADFWATPEPRPSGSPNRKRGFLRLADQGAFLSIVDVASSADRLRDLEQAAARPRRDAAGAANPGADARPPRPRRRLQEPHGAAVGDRGGHRRGVEHRPAGRDLRRGRGDRPPHRRLRARGPRPPCGAACSSVRPMPPGYHFPTDPDARRMPEPDEGWTTTTLVTELVETFAEPNDDRDDPFVPRATRRLDDQLYRWDGWSGAVRPPGSAVDGTGARPPRTPSVPPVDDPVQFAANYDGRARIAAPPALRPPVPDASPVRRSRRRLAPARPHRPRPSALPPVETFGRLEPIAAPLVVRRRPRPVPGVGDDARHDRAAQRLRRRRRRRCRRRSGCCSRPQVGQDLCELHGQPAGGADPGSYRLLDDPRRP